MEARTRFVQLARLAGLTNQTTVVTEDVAAGVWRLAGQSHHSVVVEVFDSSRDLPHVIRPDPRRLGGRGMLLVAAVTATVTSAQRGRGRGPGLDAMPAWPSMARTHRRATSTVSSRQCCPASTRQAAAVPGPVKRG